MSVEIAPAELAFHRPFTTEVQETLNLKNTSTSPIAFKVKTTAPKQYCVRPNSGRIEPGQDVDVTVILQAMKTEPPLDAKCRDKFLVQSAIIGGEKEYASVASVLESTSKNDLQEKKIRVTWVRESESPKPHDALATPKREPRANSVGTPDIPRHFSSPSEPSAPAHSTYNEAKPEPTADETSIMESINSSPPAYKAVEDDKTTIDETAGLRKRTAPQTAVDEKKPFAQEKSVPTIKESSALVESHRNATEGVPVKVVALLCMVSFLLAYFFF